jgi:hypothetical protein
MADDKPKDEDKKKSAPVEPVPSDIADQLQDMKNQKAAENYKKTKKLAKGGMIKSSASKRADGCALRGKTRA